MYDIRPHLIEEQNGKYGKMRFGVVTSGYLPDDVFLALF
jgi:hypothetical protein